MNFDSRKSKAIWIVAGALTLGGIYFLAGWLDGRIQWPEFHSELAVQFLIATAELVLAAAIFVQIQHSGSALKEMERQREVETTPTGLIPGWDDWAFDEEGFLALKVRNLGRGTALNPRARDALNKFNIEVVGSRGQAVRLFYKSQGHVDVVPAFKVDTGGYVIPAGNRQWQMTDPFAHLSYINGRNKDLGYHLEPLARKLKQWNRAHSQRLSSFDAASERATKAVAAETAGNAAEAIRLWRIVFGADYFPAYD